MRSLIVAVGCCVLLFARTVLGDTDPYTPVAARIVTAAMKDHVAYDRLGVLTDTFGPRLSGSAGLDHALDWILGEMQRDGLDHVRGEPVMVPHWVRGAESAELLSPRGRRLPMLGLGGSIGTPKDGITAEVLVVSNFEELKTRASEARGKIVVFDVPFTSYRDTVAYRFIGAVAAAKVGAVASLLRSLGPFSLQTPHTGMMKYDKDVPEIPTAAITAEDAAMLHRMQDRGEHPTVNLQMSAETLPDAPSRNVVAELTGTEHPEEIVLVSGHIDSWDVGEGALDDGGGSLAAWEVVRLLKELRLRPRRTIRVVLWTNEENGARGGLAYRDAHAAELDRHVAAIETDNGVTKPTGFRFTGSPAGLEVARRLSQVLAPIGAGQIAAGDPEADVHWIVERGVPGFGLSVDGTTYFMYHHTDADTFDKVNRYEMSECIATLAVAAYVLADMPETIPHAPPTEQK